MKEYIKPEIVIENLFADTKLAAVVNPDALLTGQEAEMEISNTTFDTWFGA